MSLSCSQKRPRARFFLLGAFGKSDGSKEASSSSSLSSPKLTGAVKLECGDISSERPTGIPPSTGGPAWRVIEVEVEELGWSTKTSSANVDDEEKSEVKLKSSSSV